MKVLALLGLVALATASIPSHLWEREKFGGPWEMEAESFQRGKEYQFRYEGQVATGIPGASKQHAATRIQALVSIVLKGEQKALLKLQHVRLGRLNQRLYNPRAMAPFMAFQEVPVQEAMLEKLQLPIMFNYEQGYISNLVMDGAEDPWSANIKKGVLNLLQVNLGKRGQVNPTQEAALLNQMPNTQPSDESAQYFATEEKTVEGECKTLYTVVSAPNSPETNPAVLNVTRSVDFEQCKRRPEIKYNFRFQDPCEACDQKYSEDQKFLKSSSLAKFNISGTPEAFLIQSAILESQYQLVPFTRQGNVITTYVNQTLVLVRSGPIVSKGLRKPKNPVQSDSDLMYTMDWDKELEEFLMKGHNQARLPVEIKNQVKMVREILEQLVGEMRDCVSEEAPVLYARLVKLIRMAEKSQLENIYSALAESRHESFSQEQHQKVQALLTDSLADAGSKDSISLLLHLIKNQKISPLRASITIKQLVNIPTPSKEIVKEFQAFLKSSVVQENFVLKQAAYLTLGSIVQGLCMPSEDRLAILPRSSEKTPRRLGPNTHLCPQQLQDGILQELFGMVESGKQSEEEMEEAVLALKTIGNMGIPKAIVELEKIIRSKEGRYQQLIRVEAIQALRQLREVLPNKIQELLMPVFMAKYETNEVRMAAAYQLLQSQPSRPFLDQMARKLFAERSHQVAAFVYTYMRTLANSSNPCEEKFARDLQLALRHGRKIQGAFLPQYSKVLHGSAHSKAYKVGVDGEFVSVISNRTFLPSFISLHLHANAAGFWSKYLASFTVAQEGLEKLVGRFARRANFDDINLDEILSGSPRAQSSPIKELKKIWSKLSTVPRSFSQAAPKAFASLKLKDQEFFMAPITAKSIRSLPSIAHIRRTFSQGLHFNIQKAASLHEITYKIPTTIGIPLVVKVALPTVSQISGQIRGEASREGVELSLNQIKPAVAASLLTSIKLWNPIVESGLKIVATAKVCTPFSAKAQVEPKGRAPFIRFSLQPYQKEVEYIRLETRPLTFTRVYRFPITAYPKAQYKTIPGEQWNRQYNVEEYPSVQKIQEAIQKVTGQEVKIQGVWHRTPLNGPAYVPICPFSGPNHFAISSQPQGSNAPKEFVLKIAAQQMERLGSPMSSQAFQMEEEEQENFQTENYESQGYKTQLKVELFTKGAAQEKKAKVETQIQFSPNMRLVKVESEMEMSPIQGLVAQPVKGCFQGFVQYPNQAQNFQEIQGKAVVAEAKATWGRSQCNPSNQVQVKIGAKHSQAQQQMFEEEPRYAYYNQDEETRSQSPELYSPVHMEEILQEPSQLLSYVAQIKYNNVAPVVKNFTQGLFRAIKTYYYWNTNQINFAHNNPEGIIRAQFSVDPKTRQFFNLTVKSPVENVTFTDAELPVPMYYSPASIRPLYSNIEGPWDLLENVISTAQPKCNLNSRRLQTFDGVSVRAPISTCWSLLSKDCHSASNPAYAILVKAIAPNSNQKALKIITREHNILIQPDSQQYDSLKVKVNGKAVSQAELPDNEDVRMEQNGGQMEISLPLVRVSFDGYSAQVRVSPLMASAQCGICGHFNGELQDEFRTPDYQLTSDRREFLRAHTIQEGCDAYPQNLDEMDSDEELEYQPQWEQERLYADSQEEEQNEEEDSQEWNNSPRDSFRPVRRYVTEEEQGKICISSQPIRRCPADSFPQEYQNEEEEVSFKCISRNQPQANRIFRAVQEQSNLPAYLEELVQRLPEQYTNQYPVPKSCSRHF